MKIYCYSNDWQCISLPCVKYVTGQDTERIKIGSDDDEENRSIIDEQVYEKNTNDLAMMIG